ncbi:radical SAM protein [Dethiobacter alkaliphilus]|uniref:radical SAM protein n=1 Tax=Dethiobacter alkaliphilus TaxID=427926 RepID=UPI002227C0C6|nr:radical SAM protein [Dethiobacter alkaliphilus]MCW3489025.1 radical SAM protein [Dethiobacter alkaliphilus]
MKPLEEAWQKEGEGKKSFLLSGSCDKEGQVPHLKRWEEIKLLSSKGSLNFHSGLVGEKEAEKIGSLASVVSFDFIVDQETIENVYGLGVSPQSYISSYRYLKKYAKVVPHLCIGLNKGEIKGEHKALEILKEEGAEALSFIVFRPTKNTDFATFPPPPLEEVAKLIAKARTMFPTSPIYLGCMRPGGRYRGELDTLALRAGVNKIVHPSPPARKMAEELGLVVTRGEECCSL